MYEAKDIVAPPPPLGYEPCRLATSVLFKSSAPRLLYRFSKSELARLVDFNARSTESAVFFQHVFCIACQLSRLNRFEYVKSGSPVAV